MATTADADESIIILRHSTLRASLPGMNRCETKQKRKKWPFRSIGSSSLLLILTWQFIIQCSLSVTRNRIQYQMSETVNKDSQWIMGDTLLGVATLSISCPIASILAEVAFGRYKLVSFSLKAMWIISVFTCIVSICQEYLPLTNTTLLLFQLLVLVTPQYLLLGIFIASAVPLGIDQINGGSSVNISALIQWFGWVYFSGMALPLILGSIVYNFMDFKIISMIMSLVPVLLLSVGLILDFCFKTKLVKEPVTVNPVSLIFKVLKYAAKHKHPVQRSAFTYCENERPTRLDYGKSKYGGPFTTEQVEDVKTFWRIVAVILIITLFSIPLSANIKSASATAIFGSKRYSIQDILQNTFTHTSSVMFSIPLYELLIYPCLRNRSPSILKSIGIGAAGVIASSLYGIAAELAEHLTNGNSDCTLMHKRYLNAIEVGVRIPFNILLGLTDMLLHKSYIEFICAQAPYNMNGLLIGILLSLYSLNATIGTLLCEAWSKKWFDILDTITCGIWFYLTTLVLAVVSSALLGLVVQWYKARERDEITGSRNAIEEVYSKYQEQEKQQ